MSPEDQGPLDTRERLSALGRILGELVHDLNNEVTVLQGWAVLARGELESGRLPATEVERVVGISGAMGAMLRDMLDAVAGRALSPEVTFAPLPLTEETISDRVRGLASVTIRFHSSLPGSVEVAGRASFWARILSNLLGNAARHARSEVSVSLAVGLSEQRAATVVLRVEDDGTGIPAAERAFIFDPFWRGDEGGSGLGLSSVAWAVAQLNGTIHYRDDSRLGGAAFEVCVPVAPRPARKRPAERPHAPALEAIRGASVLLVDDDRAVRHAVGCLLQRSGATVLELDPTGEPASQVLESIRCALPDVVLLDLRMGEEGGVGLWSRMCLEVPHLAARVIFVSGAAPGDPDWERALLTGQPVLGKPFGVLALARTVQRLRP